MLRMLKRLSSVKPVKSSELCSGAASPSSEVLGQDLLRVLKALIWVALLPSTVMALLFSLDGLGRKFVTLAQYWCRIWGGSREPT